MICLLKLEKRFLVKIVDDYLSVNEIELTSDVLLTFYPMKKYKKQLEKIKEPLFFKSNKYSLFLDIEKTVLKASKKTIKHLKALHREHPLSYDLVKFLEKHNQILNIRAIYHSSIESRQSSEPKNMGLLRLSSSEPSGASVFVTPYEYDLLKSKGIDLYYDILLGKELRTKKLKISSKIKEIKDFDESNIQQINGRKTLKIIDKKNIYIFDKRHNRLQTEYSYKGNDFYELKTYYLSGDLQLVINLFNYKDFNFYRIGKNGVGSTLYSPDGKKIKESYFLPSKKNKSSLIHEQKDYTLSVMKLLSEISDSYDLVANSELEKLLLKILSESPVNYKKLKEDLNFRTDLDVDSFADKSEYLEILKLQYKI